FDEVSAKNRVAEAELARAEENLRAARAKQNQAQAKVAYAQTLFDYTRIAAPFDGIVTAKNAEVGMLASPGAALITVEQSGLYRLEAQVGESSLAHVKLGMAVPVAVDAVDAAMTGKVGEIVPAADPQSRTFTVKIDLPTHPLLRSGLYGKASFSRGEQQVLLLPIPAVFERGQLTGVFVVGADGRAEFRLVKTGKRYGDSFEILSGLSAGERVVVKGAERIGEGSRVALSAAK
ncbi:MAG: efflux RND transporter periplasmic adaptor subunit, partial [Chloroflexota bacterium]